jgi:FSR family fosmidomycin resistance protein-like MFS transporter
MSKRRQMVTVYSASHFLVDLACASLMAQHVAATPMGYTAYIAYNFCAFAMQLPMGVIADRMGRNWLMAAVGCLLVAVAHGTTAIPLLAAVVAGVGNGLFHIGCGSDILGISERSSAALGVFVSPGALGVYLGTQLGNAASSRRLCAVTVPALLCLAAAAVCLQRRGQGEPSLSEQGSPLASDVDQADPAASDQCLSRRQALAAVGLLVVVGLRSFAGMTLSFPFGAQGRWALALTAAVALGKALGGLAADRFGMRKASAVSLSLAALLFWLPTLPATGLASLLLFNMTMPITLWAMARVFPAAKGLSFGSTTFALFVGYLPVALGFVMPPGWAWPFPLIALASLALLLRSLNAAQA